MPKRFRPSHVYLDNSSWSDFAFKRCPPGFQVTQAHCDLLRGNALFYPVLSQYNCAEAANLVLDDNEDGKTLLSFMVEVAHPRVFGLLEAVNCDLRQTAGRIDKNYFFDPKKPREGNALSLLKSAANNPSHNLNFLRKLSNHCDEVRGWSYTLLSEATIKVKEFVNAIRKRDVETVRDRLTQSEPDSQTSGGRLRALGREKVLRAIEEGSTKEILSPKYGQFFRSIVSSPRTPVLLQKWFEKIGVSDAVAKSRMTCANMHRSKVIAGLFRYVAALGLELFIRGRKLQPNDALDTMHYMSSGFCQLLVVSDKGFHDIAVNIDDSPAKIIRVSEFIEKYLLKS